MSSGRRDVCCCGHRIAACSDSLSAPQKAPPKPSQAEAPSQQTPSASPAPVAPQTIRTSKDSFTVPGKAFADGRDLEATPRLTVMRSNVWDAVPRRQRVCEAGHGDQLELLERSEDEGRYHLKVRSGGCEGWLPESFVSSKRQAPVGDKM